MLKWGERMIMISNEDDGRGSGASVFNTYSRSSDEETIA